MTCRHHTSNLFRLTARFAALFGLIVILWIVWPNRAQLQKIDQGKTARSADVSATIHANDRGTPHLNFEDGRELSTANAGQEGPARALVSADFDSDGTPDLVTADLNGTLKLYHGSAGARSGNAILRGRNEANPFQPAVNSGSLNISPDHLFAGDFNADGRADILAASNGASSLELMSGDGRGHFLQPYAWAIAGNITAITAGEIGRRDGQMDVAVAVITKSGPAVLVFEHPEGAFKHQPEVFKLAAAATGLVIGHLDADFYADIAVASGNELTIIYGRGQAYPWDLLPDSEITRPKPVRASRRMSFPISALEIGHFGRQRGESLALLSADGNIYQLEPKRVGKPTDLRQIQKATNRAVAIPFLPTEAAAEHFAVMAGGTPRPGDSPDLGLEFVNAADVRDGKIEEYLKKTREDRALRDKDSDPLAWERSGAENLPKATAMRRQAKNAFMAGLASGPVTLNQWDLRTLAGGSQLANAASRPSSSHLMRVNVSDSDLDDLLLIDAIGKQLQIVSQVAAVDEKVADRKSNLITSLEVEGNPLAVLPLRLNGDALSDLVVLREGSSTPSVVMTGPGMVVTVTTTSEDGDCQPGNECSLRNAMLLANSQAGVNRVEFNINGGGPATILVTQLLPTITRPITIDGTTQPGYNGSPLIEISGENAGPSADGIKIRASNTTIRGLVINQFRSTTDGQSQLGGNGIVIESDALAPNNGNNVIQGNYLGTDINGAVDKGNDATGLNIFDSDLNQIGGTEPDDGNLISGNGSAEKVGAGIALIDGNFNTFQGNIIGLNSLEAGRLGNSTGLFFTGGSNTFGGDEPFAGNTVSGNGELVPDDPGQRCFGRGMIIPLGINLDTGEFVTSQNWLAGNRFGTSPDGNFPLGNCQQAIYTTPLTSTMIGSITQNGRNVVSDNGLDAIYCEEVFFLAEGGSCNISGNNIGTNVSGTAALPNDWRNQPDGLVPTSGTVSIYNSITISTLGQPGGTTENGDCTGFCNLISGNGGDPIAALLGGFGLVGVFGNHIGTDRTGHFPLANQGYGVVATPFGAEARIGAPNSTGGHFGNVIAGNQIAGISAGEFLGQSSRFGLVRVEGNLIGTDTTGTGAVPNGTGVISSPASFTTVLIGRAGVDSRNFISGNSTEGIRAAGNGGQTKIVNNGIGVSRFDQVLGNGRSGIAVTGINAQIGSGTPDEANTIANNGYAGPGFPGVLVTSTGISIRNNRIDNNSGLGIDLSPSQFVADGVTANDCFDQDVGPNGLQNFPLLNPPEIDGEGTVTITGALISRPSNSYVVDFYELADDPTNHGEGKNYLGSVNLETDPRGLALIEFTPLVQLDPSRKISATATDDFGSTSEFSCQAGATCSDNLTGGKPYDAGGIIGPDKFRLLVETCVIGEIKVNVSNDDPILPTALNLNICDSDAGLNGDQCSLRAAIQLAEHREGYDNIQFEIPGGGVHTITPGSALPTITTALGLNATSQTGWVTSPLIKLDGVNVPEAAGLQITATGVSVNGLSIVRFSRGIRINGGGTHKVYACRIGINADSLSAPAERQQVGIEINGGSTQNQVGGSGGDERNYISNNVIGIGIYGGSNNNKFIHNRIGIGLNGQVRLPNDYGIVIDNSSNNTIGDELNRHPNIIAGNTLDGITIQNGSQGNTLAGSYLGVIQYGNFGLENHGNGVVLRTGAANNFIGGDSAAAQNIICGHAHTQEMAGVLIASDAGTGNRIQNNTIGVNPLPDDGRTAVPNSFGIRIHRSGQFVGKNSQGGSAPNLILENLRSGILVDGRTGHVEKTVIQGNNIGTDGNSPWGNFNGISLEGDVTLTNIVGNVISGNDRFGIDINGGDLTTVRGNKIGTTTDGMGHINNGADGIIVRVSNTTIGGNGADDGNVISGNAVNGIYVSSGTTEVKIIKNLIGTTADGTNQLENGGNGVYLNGQTSMVKGNTISGNGANGVLVEHPSGGTEGLRNWIEANFIGTTAAGDGPIPNEVGIMVKNGAENTLVANNTISGNNREGVFLARTANSSLLIGNTIGTNAEGTAALGNGLTGILIESSTNAVEGNLISGNGTGIRIARGEGGTDNDAKLNVIAGNKIGTNRTGTAAIANESFGVELTNGANHNTIGGGQETDGNLISGNGGRGIYIYSSGQPLTFGNKVFNNFVGLSDAHSGTIPNSQSGIAINDSPDNLIGSAETNGNVVGGNLLYGIIIFGPAATGNGVKHNLIGITRAGVTVPNQGHALNIDGSPGTVVVNNTACSNTGGGLVISNLNGMGGRSGQTPNGVIEPSVTISTNLIGVFKNSQGEYVPAPNGGNGITLSNVSGALIGINSGDPGDPVHNIIGANGGAGILIEGAQSQNNTINNSIVGTDPNGTAGLGNGGGGIKIVDANNNLIGVQSPANNYFRRNVISGNIGAGVMIEGATATNNQVKTNWMGLAPNQNFGPGNSGDGVLLTGGAHGNQIGGPDAADGNVIIASGGAGIRLSETAGSGNLMGKNAAFSNHGLGIDIGAPGIMPIDLGDADTGPNNQQNYPYITNYFIDGNGDLIVSYRVESLPGNPNPGYSNYGASGLLIEFFESDDQGQGHQFLNSDHYTAADYGPSLAGVKQVNLGNAAGFFFEPGDLLTAIATDASNNTSEFFPPLSPTAAGVTVSGRVTTANGQGIPAAQLTLIGQNGQSRTALTNGLGFFVFTEIPVDETYVLTVVAKRYEFPAPTQVLAVTGEIGEVTFMASP